MTRRGRPCGRELALRVLRRVHADGAYANLALSAALEAGELPEAERRLATELVYGVLRQRSRLDHALSLYTSRPLARVKPAVLDVMRLAAYQLLLLDRIPRHAAVDHAVARVKRVQGGRVAGFVNAVLRRLSPGDLERQLPADPVARIALQASLPEPLARRWAAQLGPEQALELGRELLGRAPLTARVNSLRCDGESLAAALAAEGARATPGRHLPRSAVRIEGLAGPFTSPSYRQGLWTVQDEAAQLVTEALDPRPGETVIDACAGVGGKATHAAARMRDRGRVVCLDINGRKLELLARHCERLGIGCCAAVQADLRRPRELPPELRGDRVLVDAPCTGLGVVGRHPELKWRFDEQAVAPLVGLQRELLLAASALVRPGGALVYSVCTTTDEEGPAQVAWLLRQGIDLEPWPLKGPGARDGALRLWSHRHGTDGFFIARFERRDRP